ncbi:ribosome-associated translation inhibitor RaiA [Aerococcaceae bacterium 50-4]
MFTYNVRGENIEITPAIREYAEKKISKIERYFNDSPDATAYVNAKVYPNKDAKAEVTIPLSGGLTLRAEETSQDLYGSLDLVVDKLERQVRKYKTKMNRKPRESTGLPGAVDAQVQSDRNDQESEEGHDPIKIVRRKTLSVKPMTAEEAVLQMEMLGHNFFIFEDAETGKGALVYSRRKGSYGLIAIEDDLEEA